METHTSIHKISVQSKWLIFYRLFWIFVLMSFVGYLLETVAFFIYQGHFVSRQGMIYGPFSEIYGIGAVLLIASMHRLAHKSFIFITFFCAVIGGVFEYLTSVILEKAFGVYYWDYSNSLFNLFGQTNVFNDLVWGVLGAIIIKIAYPEFVRFFDRIVNKRIIVVTWVMIVFISLDLLLTVAATDRLKQRHAGIQATNAIQVLLDKTYPDDYLKSIIPMMNVN